ncbi:hypothetical protein PMIN07_000512 [Paraphaeosphaeria minitans]
MPSWVAFRILRPWQPLRPKSRRISIVVTKILVSYSNSTTHALNTQLAWDTSAGSYSHLLSGGVPEVATHRTLPVDIIHLGNPRNTTSEQLQIVNPSTPVTLLSYCANLDLTSRCYLSLDGSLSEVRHALKAQEAYHGTIASADIDVATYIHTACIASG